MKIAILDDYQDVVRDLSCFHLLDGHEVKIFNNKASGVGQLAIRLAPFEALVLNRERTTLSRALLSKLPNLKVIAQTGRLSDNIDLEAAKELGITILEGKGDPTAPAELTWALIMAASRKIVSYANNLQDGLWQTASIHPPSNQLGRALKGRKLGIWGYGRIGKLVASYGRAFGMQVEVWGSEQSRQQASLDGYRAIASKAAFFTDCDIISLHLRLCDSTRHIITGDDLALMKTDALLINTSRAELIAPEALRHALENGKPGSAALDVFEQEPLPKDHPLRGKENVLLTPHLGYVERDSYETYFGGAFQALVNHVENGKAH